MRPGLGEVHAFDRRPGPLLRHLQSGVGAAAGLLVVDHAALDHAARRAGAQADEVEGAPAIELADKDGHLGGADLHGTDQSGLRNHVWVWVGRGW